MVETKSSQYIVEVKKDADIDSKVVQAKAAAVVKWCQHVTNHELKHEGKLWSYLLIILTDVQENMTIKGLKIRYKLLNMSNKD